MRGCTCAGMTLCPQCRFYATKVTPPRATGQPGSSPGGPDLDEQERDFQARVIRAARALGYRPYHTKDARLSQKGWFDLVLARAGDKLILAELKRAGEKQTEAQRDWYEDLQRITQVHTYIWRPADWDTILQILTRKERQP